MWKILTWFNYHSMSKNESKRIKLTCSKKYRDKLLLYYLLKGKKG